MQLLDVQGTRVVGGYKELSERLFALLWIIETQSTALCRALLRGLLTSR
jgi:hypothetical protein